MKTTGLLVSLALIVVLGMAASASAQCTAVLADGLFPTGGSVQVGDTIEYSMTVSVPDVAGYCTLYDVSVYFFPPPGEPDPCDNTGGGVLIASGLTLTPGGTIYTYDSSDNPALAHVVTLGDITDADGELILADMATRFYIEGGTGDEQCDESSSVVYGTNPCIEVTKEACGFSKVGDEIMYTICVTNCSNPPAPLYNVVVSDPLLGGTLAGFPSELAEGQTVCVDFPYVVQGGDPDPLENTVTAQAEDQYGNMVDDTDTAEVDLLHPSFTVEKVCLTDPVPAGGDADFLVTIVNTGDVALDMTTDEAAITPFTLGAGNTFTQTVTVSDPGGVDCVYNEINVTATIPVEFCELPNVLTGYADACCPISNPCVDITKEVDCDISKEGDEVVYTICITNCSDPAATLYNVVVTDPLLGGVLAGFPSELAPGETVCADFPYTIQPDDPDPLENTVTVDAENEYGMAVSDFATETVDLIHPSFTVEKECLTDPVPAGGDADFLITIVNTGDVALDMTTDEAAIAPFTLGAGNTFTQTVTVTDPGGVECIYNDINVTATIPVEFCELPNVLTGWAEACCPVAGEEGCTPGYWKNHPQCWECYTPGTLVGDVFDIPAELSELADDTLMEAMNYDGGGDVLGMARNLLRQAAAALQNACDPDIAYPSGVQGVIDDVNAALATLDRHEIETLKNTLDMWNNYGCPQDAHCNPIGDDPDKLSDDTTLGEILQPSDHRDGMVPSVAFSRPAPNPFSDSVRIQFGLPKASSVAIDVYDVSGRHVANVLNEEKSAGTHDAMWNGTDSTGARMPAGVYFYRVRLSDDTLLKKMIMLD